MLSTCASVLSRLPLRVHYAFADGLLYPLLYHVVRYRRDIVAKNLRLAFPDKQDAEREQIERTFYHQLCDTFVESIYGYRCSNEEMRQRLVIDNMAEVNRLVDAAGGGIFMLAHMGNWEWMADVQQWLSPGVTEMNVYREQKNKSIDRLMLAIRAKRGGVCVEKKRLYREMIRFRKAGIPVTVGLICDQKPRPQVTHVWTTFLHQETGFLDGGEILGQKFNIPVFYAFITCPQRGHYHVHVQTLAANPQQTGQGEITKAYAQALEKNIYAQPALWLWSHNRFRWVKV